MQTTGPGELLLQFGGSLDRETVPGMRKRLLKVARDRTVKRIVVDFSGVSSLDTAGIALLVEVLRTVSSRNAVFMLTGLSENARRMIRLARLEQAFGVNNHPES